MTGWKAKRGRIYDKRCGVIPALEKVSIYNCFCGILTERGLLTPRFSPHLCRALSCRPCGALKPCCPALLPCAPGCGHIQHMAVLTNCFIRYFDGKNVTYTPHSLPFVFFLAASANSPKRRPITQICSEKPKPENVSYVKLLYAVF